MHTTSAFFTLLPLALAADIDITVGAASQLRFNPERVTAAVGDKLSFSFFPRNHSVVQSSFAEPCSPLAGGFFSGFQPLSAGPGPQKFVVEVKNTEPIWVYCAQNTGRHCQTGMTMVVNEAPPPTKNTLEAFKANAAKTNTSSVPPVIAGGVFVPTNATATAPSGSTGSGGHAGSPSATGSAGNAGETSPLPFTGDASARATLSTLAALAGAAALWFSLL